MSATRCKFVCNSVKKMYGWSGTKEFMYEAEFSAVTTGSKENEEFFKYTPNGKLMVAAYKEDVFEVGKSYYLDIFEAVPVKEVV